MPSAPVVSVRLRGVEYIHTVVQLVPPSISRPLSLQNRSGPPETPSPRHLLPRPGNPRSSSCLYRCDPSMHSLTHCRAGGGGECVWGGGTGTCPVTAESPTALLSARQTIDNEQLLIPGASGYAILPRTHGAQVCAAGFVLSRVSGGRHSSVPWKLGGGGTLS